MKKLEKIFRIVSVIVIVGCCLFYGGRLIYYYNKLKPEKVDGKVVEYIAQTIKAENGIVYEGEGLYMVNSDYIFKGDVKSNYISYSDKLWRIMKINGDGSVKLVLNEDIDIMSFNELDNKYEDSTIYNYLNTTFINGLNDADKYLINTSVCVDNIASLSKMSCNDKIDNSKVGLMGVEEYVLSLLDNKNYLNSDNAFWLINAYDKNNIWLAYEDKLTQDNYKEEYGVRPVITLSGNVKIKSGKGTLTQPYELEV